MYGPFKNHLSAELRERLMDNTRRFRKGMEEAGFRIVPGVHPSSPSS
jgi:hypothetical protein